MIKQLIKNCINPSKKDARLESFYAEFHKFKNLDKQKRFPILEKDFYPCLQDKTSLTPFDAHYIYHPAWAARILKELNPEVHIDISSTLYFCSIVSAFIKVKFYDFRPADLCLSNFSSERADLTNLHFETNSLHSVSCMHTIEHIGLGRYGDPLDPEGDMKGINELKRVCAINGNLLFVVPVGGRRIQFNAHRIYDPFQVIEYMDGFKLNDFSLITDESMFIENADLHEAAKQKYGCGCYWFSKV